MLQVDPGREFMGSVTKEMENHKTYIRRGRTEIHRDQAIVERFNGTLAERLFGHQYAVEMLLPEGQRSTALVKRLPEVGSALNNEVTSLIGKKPAVAIKEKAVASKPSTKYSRPVGLNEQQAAISQKEIVFRFRKDVQSEKGWGFEVLCVRSPGVKGICADALLCTMRIRLVARAWGF